MSKANTKSKNASENAAAEGQTAAPEKKPKLERTSPPNHIFIGKKPVMSYAMSALIQLAQMGEVILKARGMVISRAVDVAEIITKRLGNNAYEVKSIVIDTEQVGVGEDIRNVSTIEIKVGRK